MTSTCAHTLALAALLSIGGFNAAVAQAQAPDEVRPLIVPGGPSPRVAASYPADGASAPAGVIVLKITFDQPMTADAWAYGKADAGAFPQCLAHPRLLNDNRSFVLLCTVAPGQAYAIAINSDPRFANTTGRSAKPYVLHFTTTQPETRDMPAALAQAGLTAADEPVMEWNDTGKGVSQTPPPPPL
ncbi:MAG TPA: hypothetical protein VF459_04145 [Caulobacteraceae bacterium]